MGRLDIQFLDQGLHRVLFDAMPMPAFVVDSDVNILECNAAAARLLKNKRQTRKLQRGGDILQCLHVTDSPEGCGHSAACTRCELREAVNEAFRGVPVSRRWAAMELKQHSKPAKVNLRVSCQPITYGKSAFVLLVLEGLN